MDVTRGDQPCPVRWKAFLSYGSNKTQLLLLFVKLWQGSKYASCLNGKSLHVAVNNNCFRLSSLDVQTVDSALVDALECSHEEADTRLLLHAQHAAESQPSSIVIHSPDTDVAVLCCHVQEQPRFTFGLERSRGHGSSIYSLSVHNYRMEWLLFCLLFMP